MTSPTLARDASGCAVLTAEQAAALAAWQVSNGYCDGTEVADAIHGLGDGAEYTSARALARWILRWAPVVEAAEHAYDAAADPTTGGAGTAGGYQSAMDAVADIYDAVREARGEKAKVPA